MEKDAVSIEEKTDPVTLRPIVMFLKGEKPISATFQPHLFRVIAEAEALPFAFGWARGVPADQFYVSGIYAQVQQPDDTPQTHITRMLTKTWWGGTKEDGTKLDDPLEPDEIVIN